MHMIRDWFARHFQNRQVVLLLVILAGFLVFVVLFARILAPVLGAVIIAYLLQGPVDRLKRLHVPHILSVLIVFLGFLAFVVFSATAVIPPVFQQSTQLIEQAPVMLARTYELIMELPERYPDSVDADQVQEIFVTVRNQIITWTQNLLSYSVTSIVNVLEVSVYLILVPVLLFFLMKDSHRLVAWFVKFLPSERTLVAGIWSDVDRQIGNYVRGKVWEILIVGSVSYIAFLLLGVEYALLLAVLTGFSVLIPFIGAIAVTIPVAILAYFQFGFAYDTLWVIIAYVVIQQLDGNVLQPILYSEAVNMHPVAIIVAVLFFGGIWGFWGILFAIPLATVVQAVLKAWPKLPAGEPAIAGALTNPAEARDEPSTAKHASADANRADAA